MFGSSGPIDQSMTEKLVPTGPENWKQKNAVKALAACEAMISEIGQSEQISLLVHDQAPVGSEVIVISDTGVTRVNKRKVLKRLTFGEIAETRLLRHPNGMLVAVESISAQQDYLPSDSRRFEHIIQFMTGTPRGANMACAAIDRYLAGV